jgi:hypothetical protein
MARSSGSAVDLSLGFPTTYNAGDGVRSRYNTLGSLTPVWPRPRSGGALGLIVTGQSTIANWGAGTLTTATSPLSLQLNILDGRVYPAAGAAFGADGTGNSPASSIGDALITASKEVQVCVANVAFGSTTSAQWADGTGTLARGVKIAWDLLRAHGYTRIKQIHQQGEADAAAGTTYATMKANLLAMQVWRKNYGITCPVYVSRTTFNYDWTTTDPNPANWTPGSAAQAIRSAQVDAVDGTYILAGPDTDTIRGAAYRTAAHWDTTAGAVACGQLWANTL